MRVRTPRPGELADLIAAPGVTVVTRETGLLEIEGSSASTIGDAAAAAGIPLHELTPTSGSLEDAYLALTGESVEYRSKEIA